MLAAAEILEGLTDAQRQAVSHIDGPLLVLAGPGSGKTTVVTRRVANLIANGIRAWQILALTFTNKAAGEMRERIERIVPENVPGRRGLTVMTFHSFCARLLRRYAQHANQSERFTIYDSGDQRDAVKQAIAAAELSSRNWTPASVAHAISHAKNHLMTADDYAAAASDFYTKSIAKAYRAYEKILKANDALDFDDLLLVTARLLKENQQVREEMQSRYQYLLIDEYQDTNHAQFIIAHSLALAHQNICVVGDPDQCLPAGSLVHTTRGPIAIESIVKGDAVLAASGWGATGSFPVDRVFGRSYCGPMISITTESGAHLRGTPNHIGFARLQPDAGMFYTYLMWKRNVGYRIGITRGVRTSKDGAILSGLQVRTNQEVADAVWILKSTRDSAEARYLEHMYSVRYGIPTMVFFVRGRRMDMEQDWIDRLYRETDTESGAARLMQDLRIDRRFPHHRPGAVTRNGWSRRFVQFTVFGDNRPHTLRPWHEHRVQLVTSDGLLRDRASSAGLRTRDGNKGTWRIETSRKDYDAGMQLAQSIADLSEDIEIVTRARLTEDKAFPFMPLSHFQPGMIVPRSDGQAIVEDRIEQVEWKEYDGMVYDLSVPHARNYVAGGIVVHNSIYGWRGADIRNILEFEGHYPNATIIPLGQNFRSTAHIVAAAAGLIEHNAQRKHKKLFTELPEGVKPIVYAVADEHAEAELIADECQRLHEEDGVAFREMAVLYRINALSRVLEDAFRLRHIPYVIARGTAFYDRKEVKDAVSYLRILANPNDEIALRRIINEPTRGIGKTTLDKIELLAIDRQMPFCQAMRHAQHAPGITARAATAVRKFTAMLDGWRTFMAAPPLPGQASGDCLAVLVERVLRDSGLEAMYRTSQLEEDEERLENLNELVSAAAEFSLHADDERDREPTLENLLAAFLESIALVSDADAIDPAKGAVTLMTLHAAKGLEFDVVAIAALEEGLLPHSRAAESDAELEEERRLCFVGMTRARRRLLLTSASIRTHRGIRERTIPSKFLRELPEAAVEFHDFAGFGGDPSWSEGGYDQTRSSSRSGGDREGSYSGYRSSFANECGDAYPVGSRVRHPKFGVGVVEAYTPRAAGSAARIAFKSVGVKTLILEYAKLTRVD